MAAVETLAVIRARLSLGCDVGLALKLRATHRSGSSIQAVSIRVWRKNWLPRAWLVLSAVRTRTPDAGARPKDLPHSGLNPRVHTHPSQTSGAPPALYA